MMKMKTINTTFKFFTSFFVIGIFGFLAFSIWNHTKDSALRSCIYSATGDITEHSKLISDFAKSSDTWYILNDEEAQRVLAEISFRDCSLSGSQPKDMKERNLKIAVRKNSEFGYSVMAWSRGFDNISGTDDDIYGFFNEKPPQ